MLEKKGKPTIINETVATIGLMGKEIHKANSY